MESVNSNSNWIKIDNSEIITFNDGYFKHARSKYGRSALQQIGKEAYKMLLKKRHDIIQMDEFMEDHKELHIITVGKSEGAQIVIKTEVLPISFKDEISWKFLCIMEYLGNYTIAYLGGIVASKLCESPNKLITKNINNNNNESVESYWLLEKYMLSKKELYIYKIFQDYLLHKNTTKYQVNYKQRPIQVYYNIESAVNQEHDITTSNLYNWLVQRGNALIKIGDIVNKNLKQTEQSQSELFNNIIENILFKDIEPKNQWLMDFMTQTCLEMHVVLCEDTRIKEWVYHQESRMAAFRLQNQYPSEDSIIEALRVNSLEKYFKIAHDMNTDLRSDCETLFSKSFPDHARPTKWFVVPFSLSADAFNSTTCIMKKGICYLSYLHLQKYVLPHLLSDTMKYRFYDPGLIKKIKTKYNRERSTAFWFNVWIGLEDLTKHIKTIVNVQNPTLKLLGFDNVPDIEECVNKNFMPPCAVHHHYLLKQNGHLHYNERLNMRSILLDCGMEGKTIMSYFQQRVEEETFKKKYQGLTKVTKQPPYGHSCFTHILKGVQKEYSEKNCTGCPLQFKSDEELKLMLSQMGLENEEFIESVITRRKEKWDYPGACKLIFSYFHGESEQEDRVGIRPENYFIAALKKRDSKQSSSQKIKMDETLTEQECKRIKTIEM